MICNQTFDYFPAGLVNLCAAIRFGGADQHAKDQYEFPIGGYFNHKSVDTLIGGKFESTSAHFNSTRGFFF